MKKTIVLLLLAFLTLFSFAQEKVDPENEEKKTPSDTTEVSQTDIRTMMSTNYNQSLVPPSPHAANLGKYGAVPVGLFTGTIQYDIPLYEFKTRNFNFPVRLNYSSNGLVVDKIAGWTGYDWTLDAGGVINRYQKGKDDKPGHRPVYQDWNNMNDAQRVDYLETIRISPTDLEPDIFTYNFPGYSGKFIMDGYGVPLPIPYTNLKIETNTTGGEFSYFNITTPEGIIYKFHDNAVTSYASELSRPNSWYLSKVIHPEGDSITFNYQTVLLTQYVGLKRSVTAYLYGDYSVSDCPPCSQNTISEIDAPYVYGQVKYLNNIEFHGYGKIFFDKSQNRLDSYEDFKLDKIRVVNPDGSLVKAFSFFYKFPINNANWQSPSAIGNGPFNTFRYRMFLDSLQLIGNNNQRVSSYLFEYYDLNLLPSRFSYAQDHWNYFNGKYNTDLLQLNKVPSQYVGLFTNFVGSFCNRSADPQYARVGMLKKITYPTRGYTTIDYEGHTNSYGIINGGCRVLRTKSYSNDNPSPEIKKYVYSNAQSVADSAYYKDHNQYKDCQLIGSNRLRCTYGTLSSNSVYKTIYAGNSNINYGKVEILNGENAEFGKEIHYFDVQMDTPAIPIWGQQITPLVYSNTGWMNGTHTKTETRKAGNSLLQTENISPKYNETRNLKTVQCLSINNRWCCAWIYDSEKIYYWDVVPYEIKSVWSYTQLREVIRHETNGNITTATTYGYDNANHSMLSYEHTVNSDGRTSLTRYYYPHDYGNNVQNFNTLKSKYMIGKLIDTRTYTDGKIIAGKQFKYNDFGQLTNLYIAEPSYSVTDIEFLSTNPYRFTLKESYSYYPARSLSQITRANNYPIAYLWDSSGAYVMAIVEGAEASQISSQNGKLLTSDSKELYDLLKQLAPATSLINTYTYRRHTGITKQTNPAGVNTFYEYDNFGRLMWIKNHDEKLLQKFDYKYANQ